MGLGGDDHGVDQNSRDVAHRHGCGRPREMGPKDQEVSDEMRSRRRLKGELSDRI